MVRTARILIAEDDPAIARLLEVLLDGLGRIYLSADGLEALGVAAEIGPDLVISDIRMPRMGGEELCRRLRANPATSSIPVMLMSATDEPPTDGCAPDAFLAKPFDIGEVERTVDTLLADDRGG